MQTLDNVPIIYENISEASNDWQFAGQASTPLSATTGQNSSASKLVDMVALSHIVAAYLNKSTWM